MGDNLFLKGLKNSEINPSSLGDFPELRPSMTFWTS